jgi:hypothetical protein
MASTSQVLAQAGIRALIEKESHGGDGPSWGEPVRCACTV